MTYKNKSQKEYEREYYLKNREKLILKSKAYVKETNYKYEKTEEQRMVRNIKRHTRYYFPLAGHNCEFCGEKAAFHHHNTFPIEFDRFNYVCKKCHKLIHNQIITREVDEQNE